MVEPTYGKRRKVCQAIYSKSDGGCVCCKLADSTARSTSLSTARCVSRSTKFTTSYSILK